MKKSKEKLNIYFNISENSGVGYYRQYLLAETLKNQGLANVLINDFTWGELRLFCRSHYSDCKFQLTGHIPQAIVEAYVKHLESVHNKVSTEEEKKSYLSLIVNMVEPSVETLNKIGHWANIIVFGRKDTPENLSTWKGIGDFFNIPIVMDTDDNIFATRPYNPGWQGYHPGAEALHWNKRTAMEVFAITTSTENLKHVYERDNKYIYVVPNSLEFKKWTEAKPKKHKEVRIAMLMSSSHHEDVRMLEPVLPEILERFPQVHFYYSDMYSYTLKSILEKYKDRVHPIGWIPLRSWPKVVSEYGFDIGLAPLVDNMFNRAKSNLRVMEYQAARMAVVASPVEPYRYIQDGKTGLLAWDTQEWINAISKLVDNPKMRHNIAKAGFRQVQDQDIAKTAKNTLRIYQKIVNDYKTTRGKPKFPRQDLFQVSNLSKLTNNPKR